MGLSAMSQVASVERYAVSDQVPDAGSSLTLVTVQWIWTGSPDCAEPGIWMSVTCRSVAGGSSTIMGTSLARSLLCSAWCSKTRPIAV